MNSTILAAFITLFGTILTVYVGYLQWKRHRDTNYLPEFQNDRQSAYKTLWDMLPNPSILHKRKKVRVRTGEFSFNYFSESELNKTLHKVELHLQQSIVYIEGKDGELAEQYIADLLKLRHILTAIESRAKNRLVTLKNKGLAYRAKYPMPPSSYEKMPAAKTFYFECVEKLEYWQYECLSKAIDHPYSFWTILAILLSPRVAEDIKLERKALAFKRLAEKNRRLLATRYRNIVSGRA